MHKNSLAKFVLGWGLLLSSFALLSCEIDEEKNLLFKLKDNIIVAGSWQSSSDTDAFNFFSDNTFTVKIDGQTSTGTYRYYQNTGTFSFGGKVATFELSWTRNNLGNNNPQRKLEVKKRPNDDLYFDFDGKTFTQIS